MDRIRPLAALLVLVALPGCSSDDDRPLAPAAAADEVAGTVCAPLGREQSASFAWESVTNTTDTDLDVTGVRLGDVEVETETREGTLRVTEWFLTAEDWSRAGVRSGPLKEPGGSRLPNTVAPGEKALIGITVSGEAVESPHAAVPLITYTQDGDEHQVALSWRVRVVPAGQMCNMTGDSSEDRQDARAQ